MGLENNETYIIRKSKRFAIFERSVLFSKTKCTSEGYPPFSKYYRPAYAGI